MIMIEVLIVVVVVQLIQLNVCWMLMVAVKKYGCGHHCRNSYCCSLDWPSCRVVGAMRDVNVEAITDGDDEGEEMCSENVDDAVVDVTE